MSTSLSPTIVTDGLTFAYDEKNGSKSFIGAPTTNLADFPAVGYNWVNSGAADYSDNDTSESLPDVPGIKYFTTPLKVVSCQTTSAGSQHCGYAFVSVSASTQYTVSCYFKQNKAGIGAPYLRTSVNNTSLGNFSYNGSQDSSTWPINKWIRITATATTQSNENGIYLSNYLGTSVGDKVCYAGGQVEQKSFASPLAQGTRTTSNTVFDMVGGNTITPVSPTYNSDGTISYLGGGQRLETNITSFGTNTTWEVWFKSNGNVSTYNMFMGRLLPYFGHYGGSSIIFSNIIGGSQRTLWSNASVSSGVWTHCVFTTVFDGTNTTEYLYINGVLDNYGTWSGSQGAYGYYFSIGDGYNDSWYRFDGQIPIVRIYNKALSASEVKQNFNAMRGRFGV
jgi:hypothetical protein